MRIDPLAGAFALLTTAATTHAFAQGQPAATAQPWPAPAPVGADASGTPSDPTVPAVAPGSAVQSEAVAHYERGRVYYAAGRYRASVVELSRAIALDPNGYNLYFDLGLVFERIGHVDEALTAYRRYLARVQDPSEHERAERIVRRLEGARSELSEVQFRRGRADALFWGLTAGSLALLVGGGALVVAAAGADGHVDELRRTGTDPTTLQLATDTANTEHAFADVALIAGAGLGIASGLLYALREAPPRNAPVCVTAVFGPGSAALRLRF